MPPPQTFSEKSSILEMEVNTTKDTIWRLTNRVCVLESEFKRFKELLKRSVLKPTSEVELARKRAKSAEIARRQNQQKMETNIFGEDVVVKTEMMDPCDEFSDVDTAMDMSDDESNESSEGGDFHGSGFYENDQQFQQGFDFDDSDEDYRAQIRVKPPRELFDRRKSGRKRHSVWNDFKRLEVVAENGRKTTVTICKRCKRAVSSRGYRMQKHLDKCTGFPIDPLGINVSLKEENVKQVENVATDTIVNDVVEENEEGEESDVNYEAIAAEAVGLSPSKSGRKRTPIWRHFIRKPKPETPDRPNRKYAVIAICKNCKAEVSAKAGRMKIHLQKCLTGQLNTKPLGTFKSLGGIDTKLFATNAKPFFLEIQQPSDSDQVENLIDVTNPTANIETPTCTSAVIVESTMTDCANVDNVAPTTTLINHDISANATSMSDCDNIELTNNELLAISVGSSTLLSPGPSNKASAVWQHYNITKEMKDGKISIVSAACKYCNKIVSAKSARLTVHLKKCQPDKMTQ